MTKKKAKAKKATKKTKKIETATLNGNVYTARLSNGQSISTFSLKRASYLVAAYTSRGGAGDVAMTLAEAKAIGEALKTAIEGSTVEIFKVVESNGAVETGSQSESGTKNFDTEKVEEPKAEEAPKKKGFFTRLIGG